MQNVRFRGRGFREGGGEGAERGTSMRRPRSCAVSSSERAVGNSAVDAPLSASSSCIECVCLCVDDAYACMSACMSCTNTMHRCMCLHIYLYIQMKTRRARAHTHTHTHISTFSAPSPTRIHKHAHTQSCYALLFCITFSVYNDMRIDRPTTFERL